MKHRYLNLIIFIFMILGIVASIVTCTRLLKLQHPEAYQADTAFLRDVGLGSNKARVERWLHAKRIPYSIKRASAANEVDWKAFGTAAYTVPNSKRDDVAELIVANVDSTEMTLSSVRGIGMSFFFDQESKLMRFHSYLTEVASPNWLWILIITLPCCIISCVIGLSAYYIIYFLYNASLYLLGNKRSS